MRRQLGNISFSFFVMKCTCHGGLKYGFRFVKFIKVICGHDAVAFKAVIVSVVIVE